MRPRSIGFAAGATVSLLLLAGCGQQAQVQPGSAGPPTAQPPPAETSQQLAERWADGYCGAVAGIVDTLARMPTVDPSTPQTATRSASSLLGSVAGGLDRAVANLGGLDPSPVPGGDEARRTAVETFGGIRDRANAAKTKLDRAQPGSADSRQAIAQAGAVLDEVGRINLLAGFDGSPELRAASRTAPRCHQLTSDSATPSLGGGPPA
ncbi:hypothetical protein [Amycolatopsis suaedae]|uniref:Uncharacterized protein n=1 Tax=Amycolatopsis suaedae TaxID=2510978 RepID=A0A4Q7J5N5_9PSEU|nr:hypothetical protein [Amycolatopsis suaedae]RZQ61613.1 hypothetical protein EWH70_21825 [Amycolatopsis suaedae]